MTRDEVIRMLKVKQGDKSLRKFGSELGITGAYLWQLYQHDFRPIPGKILDALDLETEVQYKPRRWR